MDVKSVHVFLSKVVKFIQLTDEAEVVSWHMVFIHHQDWPTSPPHTPTTLGGGTNYPPISMVGVPHPRTVEATHPGRMGPWVPCSQPVGVLWDWLVEIPNFIKVIKHFKGVCEIYLKLINNKKPQRSQHAMSPIELGNTRMLTNYAQQSPQTLTHLQSFDK